MEVLCMVHYEPRQVLLGRQQLWERTERYKFSPESEEDDDEGEDEDEGSDSSSRGGVG